MTGMIFIFSILTILSVLSPFLPSIQLWYKRNRCPKCGQWHCLQYVTEIITDKAVGHDRNRYGNGGGRYGSGFLGGLHSSHTSDQPFIRYWVEERYICQKCNRRVSIHTHKDKR